MVEIKIQKNKSQKNQLHTHKEFFKEFKSYAKFNNHKLINIKQNSHNLILINLILSDLKNENIKKNQNYL